MAGRVEFRGEELFFAAMQPSRALISPPVPGDADALAAAEGIIQKEGGRQLDQSGDGGGIPWDRGAHPGGLLERLSPGVHGALCAALFPWGPGPHPPAGPGDGAGREDRGPGPLRPGGDPL